MRVEWHGQSAFTLTGEEEKVLIDPFDDMSGLAADRGLQFDYPAIDVDDVHLLLITHEHVDHNGVGSARGEPTILRSTAGRLESPVGEVLAVATEHDNAAGTERGPNSIFVFDLDGLRIAHFGDFGQDGLRPEQAAVLDGIDLLFIPVGGGPTLGGEGAAEIATQLAPRWVGRCTTGLTASDFSRPRRISSRGSSGWSDSRVRSSTPPSCPKARAPSRLCPRRPDRPAG